MVMGGGKGSENGLGRRRRERRSNGTAGAPGAPGPLTIYNFVLSKWVDTWLDTSPEASV